MSKVVHFKKDCISCGACAAIAPEFWELDEKGLAQLLGSEEKGNQWVLKLKSFED
jgi:ferredoxin